MWCHMGALHWVSVPMVVFEGEGLLSRGMWRGRGVAPRHVDGAAGPRVPHRAVVQVGVSAVAQHGAQAGVSAGGAALRGGGVLPAETEDEEGRGQNTATASHDSAPASGGGRPSGYLISLAISFS